MEGLDPEGSIGRDGDRKGRSEGTLIRRDERQLEGTLGGWGRIGRDVGSRRCEWKERRIKTLLMEGLDPDVVDGMSIGSVR